MTLNNKDKFNSNDESGHRVCLWPSEFIIITSQSAACAVALNEVQKTDAGARLVEKLTFTEQLVHIPMGYERFAGIFESIFVRHMFPVNFTGLDENSFEGLAKRMERGLTFSIQERSVPNTQINGHPPRETVMQLETYLTAKGFEYNYREPEQVISVFCGKEKIYGGLSFARDNISAYNGGMHRFKREGIISRAEFKLLEAAASFNIALNGGSAIDLGAAPGGFCKVLLEKGYYVTAVDPAELDKKIAAHERLTHFKGLAEHFASNTMYDLLTNDMKMDVMDSVNITNEMSKYVKAGGNALITLKLSDGGWLKKVNKALKALSACYSIREARQLFNNRNEVMVLLTKDG